MKETDNAIANGRQALLLGLLGVLGFSGTLPATRAAVSTLDPTFVGLGRAVVAAGLAAIYLLVRRERLPARRHLLGLAIVAAGVVVGFPLLSAMALQQLPANSAAVVIAITPTLTSIVAVMRNGERPGALFWCANALGMIALLIFLRSGDTQSLGSAHFLLLAASACAALGYAEGARLSRELGGSSVISWALVLSAPFLIPFVWMTRGENLASVSAAAWLGFFYVGAISMFLAFIAWYAGLARGGVAKTSQLQLLQPLLSLVLGALLLGEALEPAMFVTLAVVLASVVLSRHAKANPPAHSAEPSGVSVAASAGTVCSRVAGAPFPGGETHCPSEQMRSPLH